LAIYPGTFDPFTPGHRDLVARARVMFDRIIMLLAVIADKRPTAEATTRAARATQCRQRGAASRWTPGPA
jgi:pantetheine-phosphate adenylyltransferase